VLSEKPSINDDSYEILDSVTVDKLIDHISSLASITHKLPDSDMPAPKKKVLPDDEEDGKITRTDKGTAEIHAPTATSTVDINDLLGLNDDTTGSSGIIGSNASSIGGNAGNLLELNFGLSSSPFETFPAKSKKAGGVGFTEPPLKLVFSETQGASTGKKGVSIKAAFFRPAPNGSITLELEINNKSNETISDFAIQFNKNSFGIAAVDMAVDSIAPYEMKNVFVTCVVTPNNLEESSPPESPFNIQIAIKCSFDLFYFEAPCLLHILLDPQGKLSTDQFKHFWGAIPATNEFRYEIPHINQANPQALKDKLEHNNIFCMAQQPKKETGQTMMYFSTKTINEIPLLIEIALPSRSYAPNGAGILAKAAVGPLLPLLKECLEFLLTK